MTIVTNAESAWVLSILIICATILVSYIADIYSKDQK